MKKITNFLLLSLFISFSFFSCSSDSSNDEVAGGISTGDYWPTTIGNSWVFTQEGEESTMEIIGSDEIGGAKYYKFDQMAGVGASLTGEVSSWIKKNQGDYYLKLGDINIDLQGFTGKVTGYEFLFFKDYLDVNQTWTGKYTHTTSYNIPNFPSIVTNVNYTGKILEKGVSVVLNGTTFKDVIKFKFTQVASITGQPTSEVISEYWIAKNIGLIKADNNGTFTELKSYIIK